jgi:hypothetical protein
MFRLSSNAMLQVDFCTYAILFPLCHEIFIMFPSFFQIQTWQYFHNMTYFYIS